jgi:hypothetical protein
MKFRYDIREEPEGWAVYDIFTGQSVVIAGVVQARLDVRDAIELMDLLNAGAWPHRGAVLQ